MAIEDHRLLKADLMEDLGEDASCLEAKLNGNWGYRICDCLEVDLRERIRRSSKLSLGKLKRGFGLWRAQSSQGRLEKGRGKVGSHLEKN